ncbi:endonuclease/exonuclease/phosphatase family protein [Cesiribacter sp. SM1]|uniref:endonuclease/exonuclease/phosphatase family protein n=1 Tax=Cesiribacter sp. SM1 TaxID=2861196 RepID=UPI001CD5F77F|nr:endonuclease/exonuclease/phosphatase family protein [Cesiribacter sp. SM1]
MENISTLFLAILAMFFCACSTDDALEDIEQDVNDTTVVAEEADLRVMTYNIHLANPPAAGEKRDLPAIARVINSEMPDLVALQEVDVYTERSGLDVHQAKALGELTNMYAYHVKAMDVFGGGAYGEAILSRFPILDSAGYELRADPAVGGETRALAVVKVALPDGREVVFAGTHLDHRSEQNRLYQGDRIRKILQREELPVILAGDFNAVPQTATVDYFDNYYTRSCRHNCSPTFPARNPQSAIDFIMHRKDADIEVVSHKTIFESYASDHLPVVVAYKIN